MSDLCIGQAGGGIAPAAGVGWGGERTLCLSVALCALLEGFESLQNQPMAINGVDEFVRYPKGKVVLSIEMREE